MDFRLVVHNRYKFELIPFPPLDLNRIVRGKLYGYSYNTVPYGKLDKTHFIRSKKSPSFLVVHNTNNNTVQGIIVLMSPP